MIHYLTIERDAADQVRLTNNDGGDNCAHDGIRSVELTMEQHFGIKATTIRAGGL
jgi:hypothetical protein